ncbi:hypothetical protein [Herbaspirillum robiniae]|uniref:hypothetical protein n=1 Tax=Herbaspirillum robiniae TaxID=2014887 RepID=UPI00101AE697|nr:hypothetical protein [Herbaspirillum robiniae]
MAMAVWIPPGKDFRLERDPASQFRKESPSRAHFSWALTRIAAACPMFADRNTRRNSSFSLTGNSTAKDKTIVRVPDVAIFAAKQGIESVVSRRSKMVKSELYRRGLKQENHLHFLTGRIAQEHLISARKFPSKNFENPLPARLCAKHESSAETLFFVKFPLYFL